MPEIVPVSHFASLVLQIGMGDDVVAIEDVPRSVTGDAHTHDFRYTRSDEIARRRPAQIMAQHPRQSHRLARAGPTLSKVADALPLEAAIREVWKEIGDDPPQCPGQGPDSFDLFFQHPLDFG